MGSQSQRLHTMIHGPCCLQVSVEVHITAGAHGGMNAPLYFMPAKPKERSRRNPGVFVAQTEGRLPSLMGSSRLELCAPVQHLTFFSPQLQYKLLKLPLRNPLVEESGSRGFLPILPTNHSSLNVRSNLYRGQTWLHILCSRSMHCQSSEDSSQGYR